MGDPDIAADIAFPVKRVLDENLGLSRGVDIFSPDDDVSLTPTNAPGFMARDKSAPTDLIPRERKISG